MAKGSRCNKDDAGILLKIKKYEGIPSDTNQLMSWVRKKYGALTSFTEARKADTIIKVVGQGKLNM